MEICYNEGMAINILQDVHKREDGVDAVEIEIANGDLHALQEITNAYGVNDITDVIAFAIGVMKESEGRPIAATRVDGTLRQLMPSESLKRNARANKEN